MSEAERTGFDHVILPRRLPGLALLDRYHPPPADNQLDAALATFATPGDTVLDPWAGTGWTARRAVAAGMRAVAADPSPFAQMAAIALLTAPGPAVLDAAFAQLAGSRRVDVPLRQHIEELYATRCAACRRPGRGRAVRLAARRRCARPEDLSLRGVRPLARRSRGAVRAGRRGRSRQARDRARRGEPGDQPEATVRRPPARTDAGSTLRARSGGGDELDLAIGESGGPPPAPRAVDPPSPVADGPRFASTVRPEPIPVAAAEGARHTPHYLELRARFPVLDDRDDLVDELLDLYTPRNLYALHAIGAKIDTELRDTPAAAVMKLALASCLLPASRLNGYPGRVASLRISAGHVRQPASRHQREVNVWRAFERGVSARCAPRSRRSASATRRGSRPTSASWAA